MSGAIRKGDLVMVVRGHDCMMPLYGGVVYTVSEFKQPRGGGWNCPVCHKDNAGPNEPCAMGFVVTATGNPAGAPVSWLIRIDPPALTVTEREEMTA